MGNHPTVFKALVKSYKDRGKKYSENLMQNWETVVGHRLGSHANYNKFKRIMLLNFDLQSVDENGFVIDEALFEEETDARGLTEATFKRAFSLVDLDHNGDIPFDEYVVMSTVFFEGTLQEKIIAIFSHYDRNQDGYLSQKEFKKLVKYFEFEEEDEASLFEMVLGDKEGAISPDDLLHFAENNTDIWQRMMLSAGLFLPE
eukprot:TRINITY_DN7395_c0_g1_i1.p1 TRINITY_DN7395_c0_g1~~TRINITY_DN7395_c0_g1_i1.p1  ORF type:complete len:201 (-),score=54.72 TRINITY_DN7395_c0_g1_i1:21-623(-)